MPLAPVLGHPKPQFEDTDGNPLTSGTLTFSSAGTSTLLDTQTDSVGATNNDNPLSLNARGEPESSSGAGVGIYGTVGVSYKVVLKDAAGSTVWSLDDVIVGQTTAFSQTTINESAVIFAGPTVWTETALADLKWDDTNKRFSIGVDASLEKVHVQDGSLLVTPGTTAVQGTISLAGTLIDGTNLNGISAVFVLGNYAYTANYDDNSIRVIDVTNPANPALVGGLVEATDMAGARDIVCDGRYAYISCNTDNSLRIVDISDPTTPTAAGGVKENTELAGIDDIYLSGQYIYACCKSDNSLRIIDISNPATPVVVGGVKDNTNLAGIDDVYVMGEYAYVVCGSDNSLRVIDISDPTAPALVGTGLKDDAGLYQARKIQVTGFHAYVVRSGALRIIDVSDPTTPVALGSRNLSVKDLVVAGDYVYASVAGGEEGGAYIRAIDVSTPSTPVIVAASANVPNDGTLFLAGKYLYLAAASQYSIDALEIYDLSGIKSPTANIGNLAATQANVAANAFIGNNLVVGGDVNIGGKIGGVRASETEFGITEIATQAETDAGTDDVRFVTPLKLKTSPATIAPASVGQSELKASQGSSLHNNNWWALPGGQYGFFPTIGSNPTASASSNLDVPTSSWYTKQGYSTGGDVKLSGSGTGNDGGHAWQLYFTASRPYDYGHGECGLFVYLMLDPSGNFCGIAMQDDPPWAYSGPTKICPHFYNKGKGYRYKHSLPFDIIDTRLDDAQLLMLAKSIAAADEQDREVYEITQAVKNADMDLIPSPVPKFSDPTHRAILIDPMSEICHRLYQLSQTIGQSHAIADLFKKGYISFDNEALDCRSPGDIITVKPKWKLT